MTALDTGAAVTMPARRSTLSRIAAGVLLTIVIFTPIVLSSQDLISWAAAPSGLHLPRPLPVLVFIALDAAAGVCVLLSVYSAWRGEPAGIFGLLVWCFALTSAFDNYQHSSVPGAAPEAIWFFPTGPAPPAAVRASRRRGSLTPAPEDLSQRRDQATHGGQPGPICRPPAPQAAT